MAKIAHKIAKIGHKIAKSKYFSMFKMNPSLREISCSMIYDLGGKFCCSKIIGGASHRRLFSVKLFISCGVFSRASTRNNACSSGCVVLEAPYDVNSVWRADFGEFLLQEGVVFEILQLRSKTLKIFMKAKFENCHESMNSMNKGLLQFCQN